jgi:hypothetical protein
MTSQTPNGMASHLIAARLEGMHPVPVSPFPVTLAGTFPALAQRCAPPVEVTPTPVRSPRALYAKPALAYAKHHPVKSVVMLRVPARKRLSLH